MSKRTNSDGGRMTGSCNGIRHGVSPCSTIVAELCRRTRLAIYLLLVYVLFQQQNSIAGYGPHHIRSVGGISSVGVEAVENTKWRPQLEVVVEPRMNVLFSGKSIVVKCTVTGWTRTILEHSQLRIGFYYEVEPMTSVPLTSSLPGVRVWTDQHDHTSHSDDRDNGVDKLLGVHFGRGRRDRGGLKESSGRHVQLVRHLVVDGDAYRFFHRGNNHFYCAATDRRSGVRHVDYFTITKK